MLRSLQASSAAALLCALAACAHPDPGPNVAAAAVQAPPDVTLASKPGVGREIGAVAANKVQVGFAAHSARISNSGDRELDTAARLFRDANPTLMFVSGHADGKGDEYGNLLLSARRAQTVKLALVARGIPANRLLLRAFGTSDPVQAADQDSSGNRCVVITWRLL